MWIVIVEVVASLSYRAPDQQEQPTDTSPRTVILVPAHNEQVLISRTLEAILNDLPPNCFVLCVAHNCTDTTAEVARCYPVEVLEVKDDGGGGKPDALKAGLQWLDKQNKPEIVVIIDADCVPRAGALRMLAESAMRLDQPVMGAYLFYPPADDQGGGALSSLALLFKSYVRPLGLQSMGLPCLLNGSGSAYPFHVIKSAPQGKGSIAEDYQLTIDLLRMGYPTAFVPEAIVDGHLPARENTALRQRRRWEHGHLLLVFGAAPRLLLEGILGMDAKRICLALEVLVPPLAFLCVTWCILTVLAAIMFILFDAWPLLILLISMGLFCGSILASLVKFGGARKTIAAIRSIPSYVMWKLPMYFDYFTNRETRWMKTDRD